MAWRVTELQDGVARVARRAGVALTSRRGLAGSGPLAIGRQAERDGLVSVTALAPGGRLERGAVATLARLADTHGLEVRVSPWRTLTVPDLAETACAAVEEGLSACGLLTSEPDAISEAVHAPQATGAVTLPTSGAHAA
jgi:precorrin-3B synthase